jgi:hypothetical protein
VKALLVISFVITHVYFLFYLYSFATYIGNHHHPAPSTAAHTHEYYGTTLVVIAGGNHNVMLPHGINKIIPSSGLQGMLGKARGLKTHQFDPP